MEIFKASPELVKFAVKKIQALPEIVSSISGKHSQKTLYMSKISSSDENYDTSVPSLLIIPLQFFPIPSQF